MSNIQKVGRSSAIITLALIISKITGFVREFLIATQFGANRESDIFKISTRMPYLFLSCVAAALATTFIPVFSGIKNNKEEANKFFSNVVNIVFIICFVFTILGIVFSRQLTRIFAVGFGPQDIERTASMTRVVMPVIIFLAISGLCQGYLQSYGKFLQPALTDVAANTIIIIGIIVFSGYGITAAVAAFCIGSIAQVLVQRPFMEGYKHKFFIDIYDKNVRKMLIIAVPIIISTAVGQINVIVDSSFASRLSAGSISVVDYASRLSTIINQVFIFSLTTVFYPMLTERFAEKDIKAFKELVVKAINVVIIVAVPLIIGMIVLSTPLVKLLLEHGKFDSRATELTALCLRYLAVGALGYSLMDILGKVFFSVNDTVTPMINGFIMIGLNILLIVLLVPRFGVRGLTMATTTSASTIAAILFVELKVKIKDINFKENIITFFKTLLSGAVMGAIVKMLYSTINNIVVKNSTVYLGIKVFIATITGVLVYVIMLKILKVQELNTIIDLKFKRK